MCHVPGPRGNSLAYVFAPAGRRLNVFLRRRAPADLRIPCPLSCYRSMTTAMLQAVRTRMNTGLGTPGVASPLQKQYLTKSNKDPIVLRLRLTCIRVWWGVFTLILNRIPRLQVQLELELIQTQMAQKPMLRAEVGMRVRCANKASAK